MNGKVCNDREHDGDDGVEHKGDERKKFVMSSVMVGCFAPGHPHVCTETV